MIRVLFNNPGNLKLSDFGLATIFQHKGAKRTLTTPCGTPPYVAPEIHTYQYDGARVDIWSSGIILYVLLAGNTPWGEPTQHDPEFLSFAHHYPQKLHFPPWNRFSAPVLELLIGILNLNPVARFTLSDIKKSVWVSLYYLIT